MCSTKREIPIFFATDDSYAPFLAVAINSMLDNASKEYFYKIFVLTTDLDEKLKNQILIEKTENSSIEFVSLKDELDKMSEIFHLRDYYSKETYYRFFIARLFPQYEKILYLDCDIIVLGDVSKLYNTDISDKYVAAAPEEVMAVVNTFGEYVEKTLDIQRDKYFNAGILLINAKKFRENNIEQQFVDLSKEYVFALTQDQDYLNVICKNNIKYLDLGWNKTSFENPAFTDELKIIHYKIHHKPWHYTGIKYEEQFWKYAEKTKFSDILKQMLSSYSDEEKKRDEIMYQKMLDLAIKDSNDPNNYKNSMDRLNSK